MKKGKFRGSKIIEIYQRRQRNLVEYNICTTDYDKSILELINPIEAGHLLDSISLAFSAPALFFPEKRVFSLGERRLISRTAAGNGAQTFLGAAS